MKAILEFNLPEEEDDHRVALDGRKWQCVSEDMDQWLRGKLKYGHEYKSAGDALEAAREHLRELREEHGVTGL